MVKDRFDAYVENIERMLKKEALKIYNERIVELFYNPQNWGKLPEEETTISEFYTGPCGDTMHFFLNIKDDIIEKATFITDGCAATIATASQTTILIKDKPISYVDKLSSEDIEKALGGLPENHKHCAILAVKTLKKAIMKYKEKGSENIK